MPPGPANKRPTQGDWWREAVIYQIYPRSFQDSNGDGIGDLPGIVQRLPHVAALGADAVWISPFYASPMRDFGYDVADHCVIDPMFGTLADCDAVLATAHELGLRVIVDLVLSHTSDAHAWFAESRRDRSNAKADWYVWADPRADGTPPNNWLSIFGGPAWTWNPHREQYYLHNFLAAQPDLNLHHPAVQEALLEVARFWLARGVDGFRLDALNFYFQDPALRDNPPLPPEERNTLITPSVNPYNHQRHIHDRNQPALLDFLVKLRAVADEFGERVLLGEVADAHRGHELVAEYTAGNDKVHLCYGFDFLSGTPLTAPQVQQVHQAFEAASPEGWPCWAFSNHDVMRHVTRWGAAEEGDPRFAALCAALLLMMRGTPCLYQGEELGLVEASVDYEDLQDPYGREFWPHYKGRDGARTPMVWAAREAHGGFSAAAATWLPVDPRHRPQAVDQQADDPTSTLATYRRLLQARRTHACLRLGSMAFMEAEGPLLVFRREYGPERAVCAFNLAAAPAPQLLRGAWLAHPIAGCSQGAEQRGDGLVLGPYGFFAGLEPPHEDS